METIHVSHEVGGILKLTFTGEINDLTDVEQLKSDIETVSKAIKELHNSQNRGIKVIIDVTHFTANYVSEAVDALIGLARADKKLVEKTAVFGSSIKIRVIGETIAALALRRNIKFFRTKQEAFKWLNS